MRDIWFRTYQPHSGAMEYITLQELADGEHFDFDYESFHWMQYAGERDRNGKDVYEGDILDGGYSGIYFIETRGCQLYKVMISASELLEKNSGLNLEQLTNFIMPSDIKHATVIGNIYQNPELLTDK